MKLHLLLSLPCVLMLGACVASEPAPAPAPEAATEQRPMDEVPVQKRLANGDRQYGFANGCIIVLPPKRAVVKSEGAACKLHHRDIALLYASGD
ncbi:hypothetical protein [Mangrovicella endophytica]|uniref:hypothetical protein n=1 Tax=Mangrovicella endophytica TaxID=2066697 RepID=UPI000C9E636B|nr:hypothetical protein [Mangrovicella endophytica]